MKKQVDITNATDDATVRAKAFINKCLNRILTETEVSASHASHFLLGHSDHKTSHNFTRLNLHNALGWLSAEIRKYENNSDENISLRDLTEKIIQDVIEALTEIVLDNLDENDNIDGDENLDDDDNDTEDVNDLVTVANTHKCRSTCYKYRNNKDECRFGYPREIVPETAKTEENTIQLKRTSDKINNYNPYLMTCL